MWSQHRHYIFIVLLKNGRFSVLSFFSNWSVLAECGELFIALTTSFKPKLHGIYINLVFIVHRNIILYYWTLLLCHLMCFETLQYIAAFLINICNITYTVR